MLRLCSHSSRSYPGRPVPHAIFFLMARLLVTAAVMGQESAEAIVGAGRCHQRSGNWKQAGAEPRKPYPAEGPNEEEGNRTNELS